MFISFHLFIYNNKHKKSPIVQCEIGLAFLFYFFISPYGTEGRNRTGTSEETGF